MASNNLGNAGTQYQGINKLDLRGSLTNTVTINAQDVLDLSPSIDKRCWSAGMPATRFRSI